VTALAVPNAGKVGAMMVSLEERFETNPHHLNFLAGVE
jgi:hypothetical protein